MTHTPAIPGQTDPSSLLAALRDLRAAAATCANSPAWSAPDDDLLAAITEAHAAQQAMTAILLHLIQQADIRSLTKIKRRAGTSTWLAEELRLTVPAARRLAKRARQVCARPRLAAALRNGEINADQAGAIAQAVHTLPDTVDTARADAAETMLIAEADQLDPWRLARSGDRVLDVLDPAGAHARETVRAGREAARSETRARRRLSVTPVPHGDGVRLSGVLDARSAAVVEAALSRHGAPPSPADSTARPPSIPAGTATAAERRADALVEVCRLSLDAVPRSAATTDIHRPAPVPSQPGVVIALNKPHARRGNRAARKRTKSPHHDAGKNGRTRQPARH
ncbi:DUF222 domain-containing protein [Catenuloplanes atrovinosus]|uniref:DUF222 domain-containing protein n=1 Tax=Catenuloplanes atrovinosus TaxID=137266 RepID=A0AAE3YZU3_9ACTN|nr:DUF222 domain-containing protein [Catenuloplanes atrovinosus]MDR7281166.1 hypothetical protein [Catenuloplanes atrovinosus]